MWRVCGGFVDHGRTGGALGALGLVPVSRVGPGVPGGEHRHAVPPGVLLQGGEGAERAVGLQGGQVPEQEPGLRPGMVQKSAGRGEQL